MNDSLTSSSIINILVELISCSAIQEIFGYTKLAFSFIKLKKGMSNFLILQVHVIKLYQIFVCVVNFFGQLLVINIRRSGFIKAAKRQSFTSIDGNC